ncbi:MAG TPA: lytic transglycosylase domain-containing protein [Gemmatimonadaceae bacterium]
MRRFVPRIAIVVVGAAVAVGSLEYTSFLRPTVIQRPVADVLSGRATKIDSSAASSSTVSLGADVKHDKISYWLNKLSTSMKEGVETALGRKTQYNTMIESKLEERHMPADLVYLAMIESEFNPNATSPVKAKGLWQFMASTARQFGLVVRGKTDERTDPEKATDAALDYLNALHSEFGSWYLAAAAYNSGAGTVRKALRAVTGKTTGSDSDFFRILPRLPKETQDYVPKLIATAKIGNNPKQYGLSGGEEGGEVAELVPSIVPLPKDSIAARPTPAPAVKKPVAKTAAKKSSAKKSTAKKTSTKKTTRHRR